MPSITEILGCFESLGDNCEFGIAQRFMGLEQLGYFRLNFATLPSLLRALDSGFANVDGPGDLELMIEPDREYRMRVRGYDFMYHTEKFVGDVEPAALLAQQVQVSRFLVRKLREDLAAAEKVFVRKGDDTLTEDDATRLLDALRRHGPVTLLWVVREDRAHRMGTVEVLREGFLKGYIDRFAPLGDVHSLSAAWYELCRNAYALWRAGCVPGTTIVPGERPPSNLLLQSDEFGGVRWRASDAVACMPAPDVPRLNLAAIVLEHQLTQDTRQGDENVHFHYAPEGLISGEMYVGSIHVWIPSDFAGTDIGAVFEGFSTAHMQHADLYRRGVWQRVTVAARIPEGLHVANLALLLRGPPGSRIYSTCWQLERGAVAGRYVSGTAFNAAQGERPLEPVA